MVSLHLAHFGDRGSSTSRDIMYLIWHVTSQDRIVGSCELMDGSSFLCITTLKNLVAICSVTVGVYWFYLSRDLARPRDKMFM